jgi:hypothetical protein
MFRFSLQSVSETFILRRDEEDILISVYMSLREIIVIIVWFLLQIDFSQRISENTQVLIFKITVLS